ncbi:MAG: membrane protein insertase YidC [Prevotellaceae bacterium]|nr:membrane protein insertase YidC [Prevotellaceae bacterium]
MDKNTITGFVLIAIVLFGFSWFSRPSEEEIRAQRQQDSIAAVTQEKKEIERKQAEAKKLAQAKAALEDSTVLFYSALNGKAQDVVLENEKVALTFSTKGATVNKAVVKNFTDRNGKKDVTLFDGNDQELNYILVAKQMNISTQDLYFTPTAQTKSSVTFVAKAAEGKTLEISYSLGKDYLLSCSIKANGMAGLFDPSQSSININWKDRVRQQEKGFTFENNRSALTYHFSDGSTDYLTETKKYTDEAIEEKTDWIAFKNQFFSAVMISKTDFADNALLTSIPYEKEEVDGYLKQYEAKLKTAFDPSGVTPTQFEFYYGPNDFRLLQSVEEESAFGKDLELERLVYLGWPLLRYINRWFTLYLFDWLRSMAIPMGIVLILITLILKAITFPMVKKSYMSSAKMRVLRPKLDEATKQYDKPEDQMQKQQAMMQLYSEYGVSPLSGCLPMLIQMPIWIAMFNFVPNAIQLRGESFLWMDDLSAYDPILEWGTNIWLIGDHLSLTCILFCVANLLYSWMSMRQQRDQMVGQQAEQMKMMQYMMFLMPLMFFFIFNDYSSGLNFYYFISLFCSAAIMWILRKTTNEEKLLAILEAKRAENKANPNRKMSGLAARMQAMQKEAEELRKKREELAKKNARLRGE